MDANLSPTLPMLLHIAFAGALGWVVGYERYFHGRALGTQVYCLVCMASCALTQIAGLGDAHGEVLLSSLPTGVTAVIGSILSGIGFLGAGIIVKSGTSVRGLTTAASIWSSSAIGILAGAGFGVLAIGLTALFALCMVLIPVLERTLPAHSAVVATLRYAEGQRPHEDAVLAYMKERRLRLVADSLSVRFDGKAYELRFAVLAESTSRGRLLSRLAHDLAGIPEVSSFDLEQTSRA